ncbi:ARM 1-domain-containing protein [Teratosphaeria destructans]|uniref:ARM 1-domain-containing protein n=1 Tax=Teratosphaeria destructans TaxID=418781 RepID=A0A9W7SMA6_9PEZI|nr:ARM 1-domain-containing protein [Teratosphaeria destructans]
MAATPLITFKAGKCDVNGKKVKADQTPGYVYLYSEDDLIHFCWRPRSAPSTEPELDLLMVPGDGTFQPLVKNPGADSVESPTNGRIYVLRFTSSSQKHYFWMQSKTQHREGKLSWFSQRDQKLGQIVDLLLQGEDVDVEGEVADIRNGGDGDDGPNGDADAMEVDDQPGLSRQETGGAGQDATGGDPRQEGEASREGGADGGRAFVSSTGQGKLTYLFLSHRPQNQSQDTNAIVQNFLKSLGGSSSSGQQTQAAQNPYATLPDLLNTSTTIPFIDSATADQVDSLCNFLPPEVFLLSQEGNSDASSSDPNPSTAAGQAAIEALSLGQKKNILKRALRSPQFHQSLGSLTVALRDGGLPMIGEALGLKVENGGVIRGGSVPLGGGEAVKAFVEGVKRTVEEEEAKK